MAVSLRNVFFKLVYQYFFSSVSLKKMLALLAITLFISTLLHVAVSQNCQSTNLPFGQTRFFLS